MRNKLKGIALSGACVALLSAGFSALPAMAAANTGSFSLLISGTQSANTGYLTKTVDNQNGTVWVNGTTVGTANMWCEMYNSNGVGRSDAILAYYKTNSPLTNNTGLANYAYYLNAKRQNFYDSLQTFTGQWSPDQYTFSSY